MSFLNILTAGTLNGHGMGTAQSASKTVFDRCDLAFFFTFFLRFFWELSSDPKGEKVVLLGLTTSTKGISTQFKYPNLSE
jgi:hypothetical protein